MAIATSQTAQQFLNIIVDTPCNCAFPLFAEPEVEVVYGVAAIVAELNVDYTVQLMPTDYDTFTITPLAALLTKIDDLIAADTSGLEINYITVRRNLNYLTSVEPETVRYTAFLSREIDRISMKFLQLQEEVDRTIRLSPKNVGNSNISFNIDSAVPNAILTWDSLGTTLVNGPTIDELLAGVTGPRLTNYWNIVGAATGPIKLEALGAEDMIGVDVITKGTTPFGSQYNGLGEFGTGRYRVKVNGVSQFEVTDTYWNPNVMYAGATVGRVVVSGGWGDATIATDIIAGVLSVESDAYPGFACNGLSTIIGSKGPSGEIHFLSNGALGHITIDFPLNNNPIANDFYAAKVNSLRFAGAFGHSGVGPQIKIEPSGDAMDAAIPLTFYNFAKGGYDFASGNGTTGILHLKHKDNATNSTNIEPGGAGLSPIIYGSGAGGNVRLKLAGTDLAGVDICNGGQYNGTVGIGNIAAFNGVFVPASWFKFTADTVPIMEPDCAGADADILIRGKGAGLPRMGTYTAVAGAITGYITLKDAGGTSRKLAVTT